MDSTWPEDSPADRSKAIKELLRGRKFAQELSEEFVKEDGDLVHAKELIVKILGSITDTISVLSSDESDNVLPVPAKNSPHWDGQKCENSDESSRSSTLTGRRGCYKRRKGSDSWVNLSPTLIEDGHSWRKYGQKVILNSTYPRSYYRCTHKPDQDCRATKQVQKTEENLYKITYNGHHTCRNLLKSPQMILDPNPNGDISSITWSFESNGNIKERDHVSVNNPFLPSSSSPLVKQEYNQLLSSDYLLSPETMIFESSGAVADVPGHDYGDVISCISSSHGNFSSVDFVDFEDVMQFGH